MRAMSLRKKIILDILYFLAATLFAIYFLIPLWQTFVGAFSTFQDVNSGVFRLYPRVFSWNLPRLLEQQVYPPMRVLIQNTLLLSMTAIPCVFFSSLTAFGLARFRVRGQGIIFGMIMSTIMLPFSVTMIPRFEMFSAFGWINTYWPFFVPQLCGHATAIFLLRQFMRNVPRELDDSAKVDGAGYWRVYWSIMMPIAKPALATTFIFAFVGAWNDFMGPLVFLTSNNRFPLSLGIMTLMTQGVRVTEWQCIMLACLMATAPPLAVFFIFQRFIIKGVVMSGLKG